MAGTVAENSAAEIEVEIAAAADCTVASGMVAEGAAELGMVVVAAEQTAADGPAVGVVVGDWAMPPVTAVVPEPVLAIAVFVYWRVGSAKRATCEASRRANCPRRLHFQAV